MNSLLFIIYDLYTIHYPLVRCLAVTDQCYDDEDQVGHPCCQHGREVGIDGKRGAVSAAGRTAGWCGCGSGRENWSEWAAPCFPYGGNDDTGMFLVPEEGASVWAEFEGGVVQYPIWTGSPPYPLFCRSFIISSASRCFSGVLPAQRSAFT